MEPAIFDVIKEEILAQAKAGVQEASLRCQEATEHLEDGAYLGAIGALAGLEERVGYLITLLKLLRNWEEAQQQRHMNFPK